MDAVVTSLLKQPDAAPELTPVKRPTREEAEAAARTLIAWTGDNPNREGLLDTPRRMVKAYEEIFGGYGETPEEILGRTFGEIGTFDDLVVVRVMPMIGKAHIAYFPVDRVVGLSKFSRLIEIFGRRLQTQEHLTSQITHAIDDHLKPRGCAVMIEAEHMCMAMRGVPRQGVSTVTTQFTGVFRDDPAEQVRFFTLVRGSRRD